jgi:hypothetical protein
MPQEPAPKDTAQQPANAGNMQLWSAVERTPKEFTKAITGKPYRGTSPSPYYLTRKASETFGPCGIGWGYNILNQQFQTGKDGTIVHIAHIRLWYKWQDETGEVEHVGQTVFSGKNKNGDFTDEDACKKSVTDALVKALSMLGFAGDIFIGRYDDSKYVQELEREAAAPKAKSLSPEEVTTAAAFLMDVGRNIAANEGMVGLGTWWRKLDQKQRYMIQDEQGGCPQELKDLATKEAA